MGKYKNSGILILIILIIWEIGVRITHVPYYVLPAPSKILITIFTQSPLLLKHSFYTLTEMILGFILAFVTGSLLAFLMFKYPSVEQAFYPIIIGSQSIPVFAIAPLLVLWFGYGLNSKIVMTALIVFFPITVNTLEGLKSADPDVVKLFELMGASDYQILKKVRIPAALPFILTGSKIGISVSTIGAVIGEWVGSKYGLGYLMLHANAQLRVDLIFAAIFYLTVMGVGLFILVSQTEKILMPWKRR